MCAYLHWVRPKAAEDFGEAGCQVLDKAKDEWQPWFVHDLKFVVLKKDQSATYDVLRLSDLQGVHSLLKKTAPGVSLETQVAQTNTLADEWKKYEEKYADDLKAFTTAVTSNAERTRTQRLHELSEFHRLTSKGNSMVATHSKFYFKVPEDACLTKGCAEVSDFCDQIRVAEAVGDTTAGDIPTLLFWDMNSLPNTGNFQTHWHQQAQAVADILGSRPHTSSAIIVSRKSVPSMSRRNFTHQVTLFLESRGVDCDCDLAFNYKEAPGSSGVLSGMFCFSCKSSGQRNPWVATRLAQGSISEIAPPRLEDMAMPFDVDNFPFEAPGETRNLSLTQRSNFITGADDTNSLYAKCLEAAFSGYTTTAKNRTQKPLAVFVCIDPLDAMLPLAVQKRMIAEHKNEGGFDIRCLVLSSTKMRSKLVSGAVEQEVFQSWYKHKYSITGHPFASETPFEASAVTPPQLSVCRLDNEGALHLQSEPLKVFFTSEAVAGKAKVLWDEVEANAQKNELLRWKPRPANARSADIVGLDMPSPPSNSLEQQYESLEKLLEAVQPLADTPSSGAHFRILVTPNKQGWAKCVRGTSVAAGDMFVSCGSGSRMDSEQAQRKMPDHAGFLCKIAMDNTLVGFRKETLTLTTLYDLHAQITLEVHPRVELSYHQLRPKSGN